MATHLKDSTPVAIIAGTPIYSDTLRGGYYLMIGGNQHRITQEQLDEMRQGENAR